MHPALIYPKAMTYRKYLPTREQLRNTRGLKFLGDVIHEPNLWHFNRYSLSLAFLIGGICCFLPMPFQTIPCVILCVWLRCNIPVSVAVVWLSNPITMGPMMVFAYKVGAGIMDVERNPSPLDPTLEWFMGQLGEIWQPLILGALVCGITFGTTGFLAIRLYYRWRITRYKRRKREKRRQGEITKI